MKGMNAMVMAGLNKVQALLLAGFLLLGCASLAGGAEMATKEECVAKVQETLKLVADKGIDEALRQVQDSAGPFVWKDSYVFVATADEAVVKAHAVKPGLIGKSLLNVKDVDGVMIFAEIAKAASSAEGKGWIHYKWPKPDATEPSPKHTYVEKVPGMNLCVGAGYYD